LWHTEDFQFEVIYGEWKKAGFAMTKYGKSEANSTSEAFYHLHPNYPSINSNGSHWTKPRPTFPRLLVL
jgi:hypothetical protein